MRSLAETPGFRRAYRKFIRRNPALQERVQNTLRQMSADVFSPVLGTHKLSGELYGLLACTCGYDCRIVFSIQIDQDRQQEVILLISIGTHDVVY